jgi:hypothetical protein
MSEQTAVEWLIEQLTEVGRKNWINNKILAVSKNSLAKKTLDEIIEQAKQMEKEQISEAWNSAYGGDSNHEGEQYYKETYQDTNKQV